MNAAGAVSLLLSFVLAACGRPAVDPSSPVGRWTIDVRATALLEHFRAPRGADAEAKRLEEEFLASEAGKRTAEAIASGLRADLELRADGGFSMEFGTIPWDPKAPQTLQTVNLRGTWTHEGTKLMLTPKTRDGGPLATTGQEMTFLFADGRISTVPQGDPGPRFTLSRR